MKKFLIYYSFVIVGIMTFISFLKAESSAQLASAIIFFPLFVYFMELVIPKRSKAIAIILPKKEIKEIKKVNRKTTTAKVSAAETGEILEEGVDADRRVFLKLIASAGAGLFMMSIFTKKTHAAFFGSVPGPGTIAVKDSTGAIIDPAIKQPTDGYRITEVDDAGSPAYYGFVDKTGAWFIMKEDSNATPNYSYVRGGGGIGDTFAAKWAIRASLSYGYFDAVF